MPKDKQSYIKKLVRLNRYGISGLHHHLVFADIDKSKLDKLPKTLLAKIIANYDFKIGNSWWYLTYGKEKPK